MRRSVILVLGCLALGLSANAQQATNPPDVVGQFNALSVRPDPLGFYRGSSPDPTSCAHYQGMVRIQGQDGTPYFLVSRSGNLPLPVGCSGAFSGDQPGNLLVVRMGSRERHGERMRSNRLERGDDQVDTSPRVSDTTIRHFSFDGQQLPAYGHPGGMQAVGDIVAIALEAPYDSGPEAMFMFIDVADPENPVFLNNAFIPQEAGVKSGLVGFTRLDNGRYLMVVTGGDNSMLWFYESLATGPASIGSTDLRSPNLAWRLRDTWAPSDPVDADYLQASWPTGSGGHQNLTFIREGQFPGLLYLAGARGTFAIGDDYLDLYRVDITSERVLLRHVSSAHKNAHPSGDDTIGDPRNNTASFAAASTFYVSPSGELLFYATEHDNGGAGQSVKAGEWRHWNIVRPGSPTLDPTVTLFGPWQVTEGGSTALSGLVRPAVTKPWITLFADPNFQNRSFTIDHPDWTRDDHDDFTELDGSAFDVHLGFDNEASSWLWWAPVGCTLRANDDSFDDGNFPGRDTRTLPGTGETGIVADLRTARNDSDSGNVNDALTSAQFMDDCDLYYSTVPELTWDLDLDGVYEETGYVAAFSAADLDGPATISIPAAAVHPIDQRTGRAIGQVRVLNAPPAVLDVSVLDSTGLRIGSDVPSALPGALLTFEVTFTDPGRRDRQSARIAFGNGAQISNADAQEFSDAHGGAIGRLTHRHAYGQAGTYPVTVVVEDDDRGVATHTFDVQVSTPSDAILAAVAHIDAALVNANWLQRLLLINAREALVGRRSGDPTSAMALLAKGKTAAARLQIANAQANLLLAEWSQANVATARIILRQVSGSLPAK